MYSAACSLMYYTVVSSALVLLDGGLVDIYTVG